VCAQAYELERGADIRKKTAGSAVDEQIASDNTAICHWLFSHLPLLSVIRAVLGQLTQQLHEEKKQTDPDAMGQLAASKKRAAASSPIASTPRLQDIFAFNEQYVVKPAHGDDAEFGWVSPAQCLP